MCNKLRTKCQELEAKLPANGDWQKKHEELVATHAQCTAQAEKMEVAHKAAVENMREACKAKEDLCANLLSSKATLEKDVETFNSQAKLAKIAFDCKEKAYQSTLADLKKAQKEIDQLFSDHATEITRMNEEKQQLKLAIQDSKTKLEAIQL